MIHTVFSMYLSATTHRGITGECVRSNTTASCTAPSASGQAAGMGCSVDSNCEDSLICLNNICANSGTITQPTTTSTGVIKAGPSAKAAARFKRSADMTTHELLARAMAKAFVLGKTSSQSCAKGLTACAVGLSHKSAAVGFEVSHR